VDQLVAQGWQFDPVAMARQRGTPVVDAMRYWLAGDVSVPSLAEFYDRYGEAHRNHLHRLREPFPPVADTLPLHIERDQFIREFGFAVPTREALDRICEFSPLLEIGAGSGAWARLLAMRGADIIATDPSVETFLDMRAGWQKTYHPVLPLAGKTAVRCWPKRNVFCCWPSLGQTWLRQAARAMLPGRALIVVREDATADERTWDYVEHHFKPVANYIPEIRAGDLEIGHWVDNTLELPNWHFLHDHLEVWIKKTRRELAATPTRVKDEDDDA
jgi:hypothetical protein